MQASFLSDRRTALRPVITVAHDQPRVHRSEAEALQKTSDLLGLSYKDQDTGVRQNGSCPYIDQVDKAGHCAVCKHSVTEVHTVKEANEVAARGGCIKFDALTLLDW